MTRYVIFSEETILSDDELKSYLERETGQTFEDASEGLAWLEENRWHETLGDIMLYDSLAKIEVEPDDPWYKTWKRLTKKRP